MNIPVFGNHAVISGFKTQTEGEIISYFSSCPEFATDALLTRCTDGKKVISWLTDSVTTKADDGFYYFYWLSGHSSGTSGADRSFDLQINGKTVLTFVTPAKKVPPFSWSFSGKDSLAVVFEATTTDIHKDVFGNMYLRVPSKWIEKGKPLNISISGHAENSNDWFMVFRYSFSEKVRIIPSPLLVKTEKGIMQLLQVYIDHTDPNISVIQIVVNDDRNELPVHPGFNYTEIPIDTVTTPTLLNIVLKSGGETLSHLQLMQQPVHRREVDIIHHSHNDIGYSHVQEEVLKIQQQNLLDALDMIDKTSAYPEGSRFKWNEETLWPVEYFLKHASETDKKRFINAVMNHDITLSGFYAGVMTGLCSPEEMNWILEYAAFLKKNYHFPVISAMLSDIPGMSWSLTDAMVKNDMKYLSNGPNYMENLPDKGDRIGSTLRAFGDKPFYWTTTNQKGKILVWTAGRGYSAFHQIPAANLAGKIKEKLVSYLNELDTTGYPYDMIQLRYTIKSDNGPVDKNLSDFVKDWNDIYVSPKLNIAGVDDMMQRFEKKYGTMLPVYSGDFTPYWEDGAYSTASEEGKNRMLSDRISQLERISKKHSDRIINPQWFYEARKNIVMFDEHTWGAWNSISNPDDAFAVNQWNYKKAFIDSAQKYVSKIESVLFPETTKPSVIEVYNSLPYERSAYVETKIPAHLKGNMLADEKGQVCFYQTLSNGNICFIAKNVPANSVKTYHLVMSNSSPKDKELIFPFKTDSITGAIRSYFMYGKEFVNAQKKEGLNQALYVKGLDPSDPVTSHISKITVTEDGAVKRTLKVECSLEGSKQITFYYTVFRDLNYVQMSTVMDKISVRDKEALHIAFPFDITMPVDRIGISDTFYIPDKGQLAGANKDFFSVQRWIDVSGSDYGITLSSPQGALFEIGSLADERPLNQGVRFWKQHALPSSTLYLYALNNYWNTNFKADQSGLIRFDCYLQFHRQFELNEAARFGEEIHEPMIAVWR